MTTLCSETMQLFGLGVTLMHVQASFELSADFLS